MDMKPIEAVRKVIKPTFFQQNEIDPAKVANLVRHLRSGGKVPPAVVATYGDKAMPLDGHHRMSAYEEIGWNLEAYVAPGDAFDELCCECRNAEAFVLCDGVKAMQVASAWQMVDPRKPFDHRMHDLPTVIRGFVIRYAKTAGDYDPDIDPPSARFNGPDPVSLLQAAAAIERGEIPQVWSEFGSGCFAGIGDRSVREVHDRIVGLINDWRPDAALSV